MGDSGTSGTAVFKEVGNLGIQVELDVLGLPTKDPDAAYYAQAAMRAPAPTNGGAKSTRRSTAPDSQVPHWPL